VGAYDTFRDAVVLQLISPMSREVAATFLPHPTLQQYISEEFPR